MISNKTKLLLWAVAITSAATFSSGILCSNAKDTLKPTLQYSSGRDAAKPPQLNPMHYNLRYSDGLEVNKYRTKSKYHAKSRAFYDSSTKHGCFILYRKGDSKDYQFYNGDEITDSLDRPVLFDENLGLFFTHTKRTKTYHEFRQIVFKDDPKHTTFTDVSGNTITGAEKPLFLTPNLNFVVDEDGERYVTQEMLDKSNGANAETDYFDVIVEYADNSKQL